jgi:signal peptidase
MLSWQAHTLRLKLGAAVSWLILGFIFTFLLAAVAPLALGLHTHTVRSGSMSPAIETGDVIISSEIKPTDVQVGDIVAFKDPQGGGYMISHRVRAIKAEGAQIKFVTRGDANNTSESWGVAADGTLGKISYRVPKLGLVVSKMSRGMGQLAMIAIPALLLCLLGMLRIWRPEALGAQQAMPPILPVRRLSRPPERTDSLALSASNGHGQHDV